MTFGCIAYLHLVRETPEALELLNLPPVLAYNPDDVARWYKSKAGCEAALAAHPPVRLEPGQRGLASVTSLQVFGGC